MPDLHIPREARPKITIEDLNGATHEFEVLPFTNKAMELALGHAREAQELQQRVNETGMTPEAVAEARAMEVASIDEMIRSTNGGTTIEALWAEGILEWRHVRVIGEYLQREAAGNPPA